MLFCFSFLLREKTLHSPPLLEVVCCMSLPWQTVLHKLLLLVWIPSTGCNPPSDGQLQPRLPSESCSSSESLSCSRVGSSTGWKCDSSPLLISKGIKGSAPHLTKGGRGMAALGCLIPSFLTDLGVYMSRSSPTPFPNKNLPKQKTLPAGFFPF